MSKIRIEWLHDSHSCETCGISYAEGALVYFDDNPTPEIDLQPVADCFGGANYQEHEVFEKILNYLGHQVMPHVNV